MTVKDTDHGYRDLVKRIYGLKKPKVAVGIFAADGDQAADGGTTLIEVAVWNEFGTGSTPARSFIRAWVDENQTKIKEVLFRLLKAVIAKRLTKVQALEQFGLWMQGGVQQRIARGIAPANAPSTIAKKGSSVPLIDDGQLRTSITFAVDLGSGQLRVVKSGATRARETVAKSKKKRRR